jgi:hypothetical protein
MPIFAFVAINRSLSRSLKELPEEGQQRKIYGDMCRDLDSRRHGDDKITPVPGWYGAGEIRLM